MTLAFAALLVVAAALLLRGELRLRRRAAALGDDVFVYTRRRLVRRIAGIAALLAVAVALVVLDVARPKSPRGAQALLASLLASVAILFLVAIWDLVESGRARIRARRPPGRPPSERN